MNKYYVWSNELKIIIKSPNARTAAIVSLRDFANNMTIGTKICVDERGFRRTKTGAKHIFDTKRIIEKFLL